MYNFFADHITNTPALPRQSSMINFSMLKELYCPVPFRSFSIKYVGDGCEKYTVNGNKYLVETGNYLIANHFSDGFIEIDSKKPVKGICIDVAPSILSEVVASHRRPDTPFADISLDTFFNTPNFFENQYNSANTNVGKFLKELDIELSKNPFQQREISSEFYFSLAEKILQDHVPIYKQLQTIQSLKPETKKELLRRITKAKEYIDGNYVSDIDIQTVASESSLSEYHFFRLFKAIFGISPHQYIIRKRLEFSMFLIKQGNYSITDVACRSGFSDIYSFSKSFKNHYGTTPSSLFKA